MYDDSSVYDSICNGDTVGLFQIESRAQIQMLTRTQPRNLDDLAVQVAIVRPGPIVGGAVNPYVRRRELLREDPAYVARADHPLLDDLLADTLGIVLYQDQVLEVAIEMGGLHAGAGGPVSAIDEPKALTRGDGTVSDGVCRGRGGEGRCLLLKRGTCSISCARFRSSGFRRVTRTRSRCWRTNPPGSALLRGGVLRGAVEQSADGILCATCADRRCAATRVAGAARGGQPVEGPLRAGVAGADSARIRDGEGDWLGSGLRDCC